MNNEEEKTKNSNEILSDEFFSEINNLKKLNEKKSKIDIITNYLKENKSINDNNISKLYDFLLSNLNENNNNYVLSQLKLIETLINNPSENSKNNFQNFAKKALPKLFDKYYLQNQKINDNVTNILNNFIHNKILTLQDYYPHIENISLDEEDNYKNNILNLLWNNIEKNEDINEAKIPKGILDIFHKLSQDNDNTISDTAKKTVQILNQRKNISEEKNEQNNHEQNEQIVENEEKNNIKEQSKNNVENNNIEKNQIEKDNKMNKKEENNKIKNDDFDVKNALEQIEKLIKSQEENKDLKKIEKKESKENNNINSDNNQDANIKEGGVKRSAIQGKLNKFRKQFGKPKKSKEIENSQKEEKDNKKENLNINHQEYKRTNTIEEMFKKKLEDGFDTETNNILDLRKDNDSNCLNEIEGKLGINFNKIINEENNNIKKSISNDNNELINDNEEKSKKIINPDDRPIHPSKKNLKLDFDLDFEQQEQLLNNANDISKEKKSPKNFKKMIISKDLEELGKMTINKSSSSNITSNKIEEELNNNEDSESKIKPFIVDENTKKEKNKDNGNNVDKKEDINLNLENTLTDINKTIDNLNNLNIS